MRYLWGYSMNLLRIYIKKKGNLTWWKIWVAHIRHAELRGISSNILRLNWLSGWLELRGLCCWSKLVCLRKGHICWLGRGKDWCWLRYVLLYHRDLRLLLLSASSCVFCLLSGVRTRTWSRDRLPLILAHTSTWRVASGGTGLSRCVEFSEISTLILNVISISENKYRLGKYSSKCSSN